MIVPQTGHLFSRTTVSARLTVANDELHTEQHSSEFLDRRICQNMAITIGVDPIAAYDKPFNPAPRFPPIRWSKKASIWSRYGIRLDIIARPAMPESAKIASETKP